MTNACAITSCNSMCSNTIVADCSPNSIRACRASKPKIVCATIRCSLPTVWIRLPRTPTMAVPTASCRRRNTWCVSSSKNSVCLLCR